MTRFVVPADFSGPAKDFLRKQAGISLTLWRKIKSKNSFFVNGLPLSPGSAFVRPGDIITYTTEQTSSLRATRLPLTICYEDDAVLVINKPAGQLVHPTTKEHDQTLANAVLYYYQKTNQPYAFHPVHRLDRNTSGLVLLAKEPQIQHLLTTGMQKHFQRSYLALVEGQVSVAEGLIDAPIGRKPGSIIERMVYPAGQEARTHFRTLRSSPDFSLLFLRLETGRTHQIRVHLSHLGHPLAGDDLYGGSLNEIARHALHACALSFLHPVSGKQIQVYCPLPADMQRVLTLL